MPPYLTRSVITQTGDDKTFLRGHCLKKGDDLLVLELVLHQRIGEEEMHAARTRIVLAMVAAALVTCALSGPAEAAPGVTFEVLYSASNAYGSIQVVRRIWDTGAVDVLKTFVSSTNGVVVTTLADDAATVFGPDGTIQGWFQPNGSIYTTVEPNSGPMFSGLIVGGQFSQMSGDLVASVAAMPALFGGSLSQDLVNFGLSEGLIVQQPDGTYTASQLVYTQWAGSQCNRATVRSVAHFLGFIGTGWMCVRGSMPGCAGLLGAQVLLMQSLSEEWEICSNYSN